jgi:acetylornithine deacetylase/succinyl-diaminopimelate desuccinylase-like protein
MVEIAPVVERISIDEMNMDFTGCESLYNNDLPGFMTTIQTLVWNEFSLPCTIGLASNKTIAKIAATSAKPAGIRFIPVAHEQGAAHMAALLKARGVRAEFSVDEGLVITDGILPGMARPLALVALGDKGYASIELVVKQKGGHSSQPPPETAIEILAAALTRINQHPMPVRSEGLIGLMFDHVTPEMSFPYRLLFANHWLFGGFIIRELEKAPATNAGLRTTITATMFSAGEKDNMLPPVARAVINCRLLPGDTIESVTEHIRKVMRDDRIEISVLPGAHDASPAAELLDALRLTRIRVARPPERAHISRTGQQS